MGGTAADAVIRGGPVLGVPGSASVSDGIIVMIHFETHRNPPNSGRCDVGAIMFVE